MSRSARIRRRRLGVATVFAVLFCFAGMATAGADTELGGFQANATAAAISIVYNQPSIAIPSGDCPTVPIDLSRTTATTDQATGHGLASVAWPCDFFANVPSQAAEEAPPQYQQYIVNYPVRAETFYPQGPTNQHTGAPVADMVASSVEGASNASANYGSLNFPGIITTGQVTSVSQGTRTATGSLSTSTVALHDVDILQGLIHFDTVQTTVTATSDTEQAKVEGGSTYAGLTVFGVPAVIDADGVHFEPKPPQQSSNASNKTLLPGSNLIGGRSAPAAGPLATPTPAPSPTPSPSPTASPPPPNGPIGQVTNPILQQTEAQLEKQLAKYDIEFSPSSTIDVVEGASGSREVDGITITLKGETVEPYFEQLPQAVQDFLTKPRCGPTLPFSIPDFPNPVCFGLTFDQSITLMLGSASVKAAASPAFTPPPLGGVIPSLATGGLGPINFGGTGFPGTTTPGTSFLPTGSIRTASGLPITALFVGLALGLAVVGAGGLRKFAEAATTAPLVEPCPLEKP
jgi:hypothetical protein